MSMPTLPLTDVRALGRFQQSALVIGVVALIAGAAGAATNLDQFFRSWLIGFLFCLSLSLGCLGLLMLQHLSGGQWGLVGRRVFEAGTRNMPLVVMLFIPVVFGLKSIFLWADSAKVQADHILQLKAPYLNVTFFIIRAVVYFAFWLVCVWLLNRWSAEQDQGVAMTKLDSVRFRKLSAPGLLFLVLTVTFASIDWIMSVDPHWFSTIFGLLTVTGYGLSALALTIIVLSVMAPELPGAHLTARQFHDLGKLLLAFVMLWAYLSFSQFLIIWSGNLPEEIPWYIQRVRGSWGFVAILLVVGHFALPFALLLSRNLKRRASTLAKLAFFVLAMRLIDLIWLIAPTFSHSTAGETGAHVTGFPIHWMDFAIPIGLTAIWLFLFVRQLRSRALFPANDPYFKEAFAHDAH